MKLIIGLGNPGDKYLKTRHNLGFMALDEYVKKHLDGSEVSWELDNKFKSEILKLSSDLWLVKPQTFMNNSGQAVQLLTSYYKIPSTDLIVIHDDLDLVLGKIKVRLGGAAGGHHGVESIINTLGTDQFNRLRLGIGNDRSHSGEHKRIAFNAEHFVLEPFVPAEKSKVKHLLKQSLLALDLLLKEGLEVAQNQFN